MIDEFVAARLDELEAAARDAVWLDRTRVYSVFSYLVDADALHVELHGPDRVLVDVAAKRLLFDAHRLRPPLDAVMGVGPIRCRTCLTLAPCVTLRILASCYSIHPDFDPAWAVNNGAIKSVESIDDVQEEIR